jgi:hypothetical protein
VLPQTAQTVALPAQAVSAPGPRVPTAAPSAAAAVLEPAPPRKASRRTRTLVFVLIGVFLLLAGAGLVAVSFSSSRPATLQVVGQYPFRSGEIYIWVDGDLRYHDELRSAPAPHAKLPHPSASGGNLALTLPVTAGRHTVRIQVDAAGQIFDHDTAIPGLFRAYSQKTLLVNFGSRALELRWE